MGVTAGLGYPQATGLEPGACGDILRIAELRGGDPLSAEIDGLAETRVRLHNQDRSSVDGAGNDANLLAARASIGVDYGIWPT